MQSTMIALTISAVVMLFQGNLAAQEAVQVDLNQHGFLPSASKGATVTTDATVPLSWRLLNGAGELVAEGTTLPRGVDTASGQNAHQIDFSAITAPGTDYVLAVEGAESMPFTIDDGAYEHLKYDALSFFYHQRASTPIEAEYVGEIWARPAAHDPDKATCVGPKDHRGNKWGGCPYTLDVSKGWYDAGDHGKYVVNGGISVWTLMNYYEWSGGAPALADGQASIPEAGNGVNDLLDEVRWQMEFMLAMQVPEGTMLTLPRGDQFNKLNKLKFSEVNAGGLVHHKIADEYWTSLPMPPHEDPAARVLHYPSTAATLNLAASAAQCARLWMSIDEAFSDRCLIASKRAYAAAKAYPDLFAIDVTDGGSGAYGDPQLSDEFYWAATELYLTTGEANYKADMQASPHYLKTPLIDGTRDIAWPAVEALGTLSLLVVENELPEEDMINAKTHLLATANQYTLESVQEGYAVPFTRNYNWGSNGDMSNRGIILAMAYDMTGDEKYLSALTGVVDYLLGRNPLGQSYVAGYGEKPMVAPHHRYWLRVLDDDLPPPPAGALAGGANSTNPADEVARDLQQKGCAPQMCYADDYRAYALNEVAINWNAPFFWIAAAYDRFADE